MKSLIHFNSLLFTTRFYLVLVPCLLGMVSSAVAAKDFPDRLEILAMVKDGQFAALDTRLSNYQQSYEAGHISEEIVDFAFMTFSNSDPDLESQLNEWIKQTPNSYSAVLARGVYYWRLGWLSRGTMLAKDTPGSGFDKMREYFKSAVSDLVRAIQINNKLGTAYALLIDLAVTTSGRDAMLRILKAGLSAVPDSFVIRYRYLHNLQPWWGGSLTDMRAFIDETKRRFPRDEALKVLEGFYDFTIAEGYRRSGKGREAIRYYNRALSYGEHGWYRYRIGLNYFNLKQYGKALENFNRAVSVRPQMAQYLNARAFTLRMLGQFDEAFNDWGLALDLDPLNPNILIEIAYAFRDLKLYDEALISLNSAVVYGAYNHNVRDVRGRLYLYELDDPVKAIEDLRITTELQPGRSKYWFNYGVALYKIKKCEAVRPLTNYRKVCQKKRQRCNRKNVAWAKGVVEHLTKNQMCRK